MAKFTCEFDTETKSIKVWKDGQEVSNPKGFSIYKYTYEDETTYYMDFGYTTSDNINVNESIMIDDTEIIEDKDNVISNAIGKAIRHLNGAKSIAKIIKG